jgi:anaerobic selenocysteine-containing dehydrogenase
MFDETADVRLRDRRAFLKGSALFAAAVALTTAAPAAAQQQQQPAPTEETKDEAPKDEAPKKKVLLDKDGREYRVCDMCGGNMYKDGKTWTCEQCGYSYEE